MPADDFSEIEAAAAEPGALWRKALPLASIFFCASFNLTILATLKDAILVTAAGAEALPILSAAGVLPASLAFFAFYSRCVESLPARAVFYAAVAPLVSFYALFATVIYPASAWLHPAGLAARLAPSLPAGLAGAAALAEHWTFALFYCAAELWGPAVIALLFWSLANEVCSVRDAKAIYPLMGIAANVALVCSGNFVKAVTQAARAAGRADAGLGTLVATVVALTVAMCAAKAWVDVRVPRPDGGEAGGGGGGGAAAAAAAAATAPTKKKAAAPVKKKKKGSWSDAASALSASPLISNLALLVVGYGVSHRLFEFAWKGALRALHPSAAGYQAALADVSIATGWLTIGLMLGGRLVFQLAGWTVAAAATPAVMLAAGGAFFGLSLAAAAGASLGGVPPATLAAAGVAAGSLTQVFARASKFSLFDPAKEMVYIEMDPALKKKGKAAVDLVGAQVGKSGGAWITQALLMGSGGSLAASLPGVSLVYAAVIGAWAAAVGRLGRQMAAADAASAAREAAGAAERSAFQAGLARAAALVGGGGDGGGGGTVVAAAPLTAAEAAAGARAAKEVAGGAGVAAPPVQRVQA